MNIKRMIAFTLSLMLCTALCACTAQTAAAPTNVPENVRQTPEPEGMKRVFGKDIAIACDAPEDGLFAQGVREQAERVGIAIVFIGDEGEGENCDALIHYRNDKMDTSATDVPYVAVIGDDEKDEKADGLIIYEKEKETDAALRAMFTYPSHEAPVRILGLFTDIEGETAKEYLKMEEEGKLQSKGVFAQSDGAMAEDWLEETLPGIGIGVLDTVFAQTPELTMQGFNALKAADRNDAVEICAAGLTREQIEAMQEDHFLMGLAVGFDEYGAGMLALRMCAAVLAGEDVDTPVRIEPFALYSDDVRELQKQGVTNAEEVLEHLDERMAKECDYAFLEYLSEYYKA